MHIENTKDEVTVAQATLWRHAGVRVSLLSLACLATLPAWAEDTPLSLTLTQAVKHDSNFSRNAEQQSEDVSSTSVGVGLNKNYGRQNYRAAAVLGMQRYSHFKELKNDSKDANLGFSSGLGSNWNVAVGAAYSESLNPIQNNNAIARVIRNIRTYNDQNASLQYGNGGRWALVGLLDSNKVKFSQNVYGYQNADQQTQGLRAQYNSSDLLQFGLGARVVRTRYPLSNNERLTDRNLDFSVSSQVSGLSAFQGVISRRQGHYEVADRNTSGWTGSANWSYTPRGLVTYNANLSRSTGADRYQQGVGSLIDLLNGVQSYDINYDTITTTLNLSARLQATGKVSVTTGYVYTKYDLSRLQTPQSQTQSFSSSSNQANSRYRGLTLSANYAAMRNLNLGCGYTNYSQTADIQRVAYQGHMVDCNLSYTLD